MKKVVIALAIVIVSIALIKTEIKEENQMTIFDFKGVVR